MNWETYLDELYDSGITLWPDGDDLLVEGPPEALTSAHLQALKTHKHDLIHFLRHAVTQYPLSSGQQGLWFEHQMMADGFAYNASLPLRIHSVVEPAALCVQQAFQLLVNRHPALRTTFPLVEGQPIQQVRRYQEVQLEQVDASQWTEQELKERVRATHERPFDLTQGPLFRLFLFTRPLSSLEGAPLTPLPMGEGKHGHVFLFTVHHLIFDGWSNWLLLDELRTLLTALLAPSDEPAELPALQSTYRDYVAWEARILQEKEEQLWDYWKSRLGGELPLLDLPTDRPRSAVRTYQGASLPLLIPNHLTQQLTALARRSGVTLYMVLLAAFQILLHRYTGQEDILVGSPIAGRSRPEFASIVGYFVNPVVMRAELSANLSFRDFLGQVRQTVLGAIEHQDFPFPRLVQRLQPPRVPGVPPIFQAMFALQKPQKHPQLIKLITATTTESVDFGGLHVSSFPLSQFEGQFDLYLQLFDTPTALMGSIKYNPDLFDVSTIERMAGNFQTLLEGIVANPETPISDLPLLTDSERHQLLVEWNNTATMTANKGLCVHQLFEEQVTRTPDAIAVMFGSEQLTYRDCNERANQLAHHLIELGVGPEVLVGICMERSIEMVVGLLGIIKAGGAYVPLDPTYPQQRLAFMLNDAPLKILLSKTTLLERLPEHQARVICLDNMTAMGQESRKNPTPLVAPDNLAYVLYTSGSTGKPKGVAIEHKSPVALLDWAGKVFTPDEYAGVLASTSICFDLSVFEIFLPLSQGGKVILAENALHMPSLPAANLVTLINTVPSAAAELVREASIPANVRTVCLAGEPLSTQLVQKLYQQASVQKVFDLYGPSEDTTYSTFALRSPTGPATIGRPIANTQLYLLSKHRKPVPIGVPGEIHLSGAGLARGYLNRSQLTAEKFIQNPFIPSQRLYKTGDLARYLPDGNLEFLGRIDNQVKIRGFRIELGEIEAVLANHAQVREVVVVVREDASGKRLVAYLVPEQQPFALDSVRAYLSQKLPDYMIPSAFVPLEALPLTPNGKIDRRALPAPTWQSQTTYVAPQNEVERQIVAIWQEVLSVEKAGPEHSQRIGVHDNFFELGGHSLLAIQVVSRLRDTFSVELPLRTFFERATISTLAKQIEALCAVQDILAYDDTDFDEEEEEEW